MKDLKSSKKVALITGANKGIGKEIARQLGKQDYTVLIGSRTVENGLAAQAELKEEGIDARAIQLEVTDEISIQAALKQIDADYGKLDALINNAGILAEPEKPSEAKIDEVRKVYETNVFAPMRMIQVFLPLLKKSAAGRIVNVSSGLGSLSLSSDPSSPFDAVNVLGYCSSKTALNAVTVQFAKELRGTTVKINSACPGHCSTDLNGHSGPRTPAQGAIAPVRLATLGSDGPSGKFYHEDGEYLW